MNIQNNLFLNNFHQKIYNLCSQIPKGYISTYKQLADYLKTSPRAIGQVLKNNPFPSNVVPCHRVIASNFFIGGFRGKWGSGKEVTDKKEKLSKEGVFFNEKGYLLKDLREKVIFQDFLISQ